MPARAGHDNASATWDRMMAKKSPAFQPLTGCFEPSAIQQLPDGRFLVVEDEERDALSLITIEPNGGVNRVAIKAGLFQMFSAFWKLNDLEGLALDQAGFVYAVTSHSRDESGEEKQARESLVRFRIEGNRVVKPTIVDGLKRAMISKHPALAVASKVRDVKADGGLNIEALEMTPDQQKLLIGFRSPLLSGRAIIASVENPSGIFEADEAPRVAAALEELDLHGNGIRGLSYVSSMGEYLVIGGPASRQKTAFGLWLWSGKQGASARRVTVPGLDDLARAEGVCPAIIDGVEQIIIVCDDGDRKAGRFANYAVLDLGQLKSEP